LASYCGKSVLYLPVWPAILGKIWPAPQIRLR
jgi:hypothetical protein